MGDRFSRQGRSSSSRSRPTIGFLAGSIDYGAGRTLWPGVLAAASQHDTNLVCFPGGGLGDSSNHAAQRNAIYRLVSPETLDGLVSWTSTVAGASPMEEVTAFHSRFKPLPMVSLALPMAGVPVLSIDSYRGMRAAVEHLIQAHGYRRLAFLRGPESHFYAQERYQAYLDVLRESGIPIDPVLVAPPVQWDAGARAIGDLIDVRKLRPGSDFQAVVAVSDILATTALDELHARGVRVPWDVAVVGFNDSPEGRSLTPPLTSVSLPFYEQGRGAVDLLVRQLAGEEVAEQSSLPCRLVVRQSCGCQSQGVALAGSGLPAGSAEVDSLAAEINDALGRSASAGQALPALVQTYFDAVGGDPDAPFLQMLESNLRAAVADAVDPAGWQDAVSVLRARTVGCLAWEQRALAENLLGQGRVLIAEAGLRAQAQQHLRFEQQAEVLVGLSQALVTTFDLDELAGVLARQLPGAGIASCYIALYEGTAPACGLARLVLAYCDGKQADLGAGGLLFGARELVPRQFLPADRRYSLVAEPLFFQDETLGHAVFEIGPEDGAFYEVLRGNISSALKGALLYREAQHARQAAEKADKLKTRLLANVSHELRTPLNIIIERATSALQAKGSAEGGCPAPTALEADLQHIRHSAEHQLRITNDLLDLSRAEIDALDLYPELLDPRPLLEDAFNSVTGDVPASSCVPWDLHLPPRLPLVRADPIRLRQVLLNLLSNARKFTAQGRVTVGAETEPARLHIWVADTGRGIPAERMEQIFQPFSAAGFARTGGEGIGLGLSISRRLITLHGGSLTVESTPEQGSVFHVYLPLPTLSDRPVAPKADGQPVLLVITADGDPAPEIVELSRRSGLAIRSLRPSGNPDAALAGGCPQAVAWDLRAARPSDWALARRLQSHPLLSQTPFILYARQTHDSNAVGLTSLLTKPASAKSLLEMVHATCLVQGCEPVLIVDDDAAVRETHCAIVAQGLPGHPIRTAEDGAQALEIMRWERPGLVVLDLMMPGIDGFDVLDRMRSDPRTREVPVVIMSMRRLSSEDIKRLEAHALVTLQSKDMLSDAETAATLHRALFGSESLPQQTGALVKRAIGYLHQNYSRPLARWEIAESVGVSEDYLSRVFHKELGLSPWEYLNRYRIHQAKELLRQTDAGVGTIARRVGFRDQAYFSRMFHKITGMAPASFRSHLLHPESHS